jgi:hypothetical protein
MKIKWSATILILVLTSSQAYPQKNNAAHERPDHFSLAAGSGWTHYFNNLEYGDKNIVTDFSGVSLRFFWETEYKLALGLELGYYRMFRVKGEFAPGVSVESERNVIPLMMLVRMRIADRIYLGTGFGLAILKNRSSGPGNVVNTNTLSLSNYQASASYIYPVNNHLRFGGEMKLYYYGSLYDWMYSLQVLCAIRF